MKECCIIDACAIIAFLKKEKGHETMLRFFSKADTGDILLSMHKLNLLEVYYGFYRDDGKKLAETVLADTLSLPISFINDISSPVFREAGRLKTTYDISLADSIALSMASVKKEPLITSDHHEFDKIESKEAIKFIWIR